MKYAFFEPQLTETGDLIVSEIVEAPRQVDGQTFQLYQLYHADIVRMARACSDTTVIGSTFDISTGEYTTPIEQPVAQTESVDTGNGELPSH